MSATRGSCPGARRGPVVGEAISVDGNAHAHTRTLEPGRLTERSGVPGA